MCRRMHAPLPSTGCGEYEHASYSIEAIRPLRNDAPFAVDQGDGGFIAGRFDAENYCHGTFP